MDKQKGEHKGKKYKPSNNHPWKNAPTPEVMKWAKAQSDLPQTNDFKVGGGRPPWNK